MYGPQVEKFLVSYNNRVAWGKGDHEEAVQEAIKVAFPALNESEQAELYVLFIEGFDEYRSGMVPRRLWVTQLTRKWMGARAGANFNAVLGRKVAPVHARADVPATALTSESFRAAENVAAVAVGGEARVD